MEWQATTKIEGNDRQQTIRGNDSCYVLQCLNDKHINEFIDLSHIVVQ